MADLVKELREAAATMEKAVDEIDRLRYFKEGVRKSLAQYAKDLDKDRLIHRLLTY